MPRYEVELDDGRVLDIETEPAGQQPSGVQQTLRTLFGPAETIRRGVTRTLTPLAERAAGRPGIARAVQVAATAATPPVALTRLFPRQTAELFSEVAATPADPTTYLFGLGGTLRNRLLRGMAGAVSGTTGAVGRVMASDEGERDPSTAILAGMLGGAAGGVGAAATRVTPRGIRLAPLRDLTTSEQAHIGAAKQAASALGAPTGHVFGRRGILGTARERMGRVLAKKEQQLAQRAQRALDPLQFRRQQLATRFQQRLAAGAEQEQHALEAARARTRVAFRQGAEAEQRELATLSSQQRELQDRLYETTWGKVQAVRERFPSVAVKSSTQWRRLITRGLRRAGHRPIGRQEFFEELSQQLPDDPDYVSRMVDELFPSREGEAAIEAISARQAHARLLSLGESISRPAKRSVRSYTAAELRQDRTINALVTLLERRGAPEFRAARTHWAQWAPLRDRIFRDFKPFLTDPLDIDAMTNRLLTAAQESRPRFVERLEHELNIPIFPELRQALGQLDDVQAQQVALKLRSDVLREQAKLTGSREATDIAALFGQRRARLEARQARAETLGRRLETDLKAQHAQRLQQLRDNFEAWSQDVGFQRRFGAAGGVSIAAMLLYWNLISNAIRAVSPGTHVENF